MMSWLAMTCVLRSLCIPPSTIFSRYFSSSIASYKISFCESYFNILFVAGHVQVYGSVQIDHRVGQGEN